MANEKGPKHVVDINTINHAFTTLQLCQTVYTHSNLILPCTQGYPHVFMVEHVRNVMAHAQKPDLVFRRNGRVHLNRRGCQFSRLLALEECGSADSNCIDRAPSSSAKLLATHSICIFPLHFPSRASPCAIRFRTRYTICRQLIFINPHKTLWCQAMWRY